MKASRSTFSKLALLCFVLMFVWTTPAEDPPWTLPPETVTFKPGPGAAVATANCLLCHSADYISTQPRFDRAVWTATVQKMREKYGAPINTNSVEVLVNYLVKTYGKEPSP